MERDERMDKFFFSSNGANQIMITSEAASEAKLKKVLCCACSWTTATSSVKCILGEIETETDTEIERERKKRLRMIFLLLLLLFHSLSSSTTLIASAASSAAG